MQRFLTICILVILSPLISRAVCQGINTLPFDAVLYEQEVRNILDKLEEPGAYRGKIALDFADYHNAMIRRFPNAAVTIEQASSLVAKEYGLSYALQGDIIATARFAPIETKKKTDHTNSQSSMQPEVREPVEIFKVVEQMPRFPGCEDLEGSNVEKYQCAQAKLLEYIYAHLQYPAIARNTRIEGRSVVQFVVETDSRITDIQCVRGLGYGLDEEVIRLVESMNHMSEKWTPGKQRGKPVRVQFTLPISFRRLTK